MERPREIELKRTLFSTTPQASPTTTMVILLAPALTESKDYSSKNRNSKPSSNQKHRISYALVVIKMETSTTSHALMKDPAAPSHPFSRPLRILCYSPFDWCVLSLISFKCSHT